MARGSCRAGCGRSFAVKVMTPNPRNAKKVRATLEMISRTPGYPAGARSDGFQFAMVTTANRVRMASTMLTMIACTRATAVDPTMLSVVMTTTSSTANTTAQTGSSSVDDRARVAAERCRDHRRDDRSRHVEQPRHDAGDVPLPEPLREVGQHAAGRRVGGAELGERVALQPGDRARDEERQPHRRPATAPRRRAARRCPRRPSRPRR